MELELTENLKEIKDVKTIKVPKKSLETGD